VESAELQWAENDRRGVALVFRQVSSLHLQRGDLRRAFEAGKKEVEAREGGLPDDAGRRKEELAALAAALHETGELARRAGEIPHAPTLLARALELRHGQQDLTGAGRSLVALGHALLAAARPRAARAKLEA